MKYRDFLNENLADPEFKKIYDADQKEFDLISQIITLRKESKMTQHQLSIKTGISQADLSRIERGKKLASYKQAKKIAGAFNKEVKMVLC